MVEGLDDGVEAEESIEVTEIVDADGNVIGTMVDDLVVATDEETSIVDETIDVFDREGNLIAEEERISTYDADGHLVAEKETFLGSERTGG